MNFENGGVSHAPQKPTLKRLPYKILLALDAVLEMKGLKAGQRMTLKTICRYLSQHTTTGEVYASRENIAKRTGASVPTVNRHITLFQQLGLLTVEAQGHKATGRYKGDFKVTHIFVSPALLEQIGLVEPGAIASAQALPEVQTLAKETPGQPVALANEASIKMSDAYIYDSLTEPSIVTKKEQRGRNSEPTVPKDFTPLLERGMWPKSICKLMKKAQNHGHWLSHVWLTVQARIEELDLTGQRLKEYLESSIINGKNFSERAAKAIEKAKAGARVAEDRDYLTSFRTQYAGQVLKSADGREWLDIGTDGKSAFHQIAGVSNRITLERRQDVAWVLGKVTNGQLAISQRQMAEVKQAPVSIVSTTGNEYLAMARAVLGKGKNSLAFA